MMINPKDAEAQMTYLDNRVKDLSVENFALKKRLRDEFAMHAPDVPFWFLPADLHIATRDSDMKSLADRFFEWKYFYADQMLKAREQSK